MDRSPSTDAAYRPTLLEVASGMVVGPAAPRDDETPYAEARDPRRALEESVLPALARPPCLVSFSGGRDSSLVLTIAAAVAAREGLEAPIPVTVRVAGAPAAEENWHQDALVHHLGLREEWLRLEYPEGELDWVGPVAAGVLRRHGLLWPPNAFFHAPMFERARGGSLLTGVGGDQLMSGWDARRAIEVVGGRTRPEPRDLLRVGLAFAPRPVRAAALQRRTVAPEWLTAPARQEVVRLRAAEDVAEPRPWDRRVRWVERRRGLAATRWSLGRIAQESDTLVLHPLADPAFAAALAHVGGRTGLGDRRDIIRMLVADLLPEVLLGRGDKALFHEVFYSRPFREFVRDWDGGGVDPALVDARRLRAEWEEDVPHAQSALLIQAAWLSASGGQLGEAIDGRPQR